MRLLVSDCRLWVWALPFGVQCFDSLRKKSRLLVHHACQLATSVLGSTSNLNANNQIRDRSASVTSAQIHQEVGVSTCLGLTKHRKHNHRMEKVGCRQTARSRKYALLARATSQWLLRNGIRLDAWALSCLPVHVKHNCLVPQCHHIDNRYRCIASVLSLYCSSP